PSSADVSLERHGERWFVADDVHGAPPRPALASLSRLQLDRARAVLEHYRAYSLPLRITRNPASVGGWIELSVRLYPRHRTLGARGAQGLRQPPAPAAPPALAPGVARYLLRIGDPVYFELRNRSPHPLHIALLNAAASGRVQFLGDDVLAPEAFHAV